MVRLSYPEGSLSSVKERWSLPRSRVRGRRSRPSPYPVRETLTDPCPRRENPNDPWLERDNLTKTQSRAHRLAMTHESMHMERAFHLARTLESMHALEVRCSDID